jgi:CheY-like chemotaxis protein
MLDTYKLLLCIDDDEEDSAWIGEAISEIDPQIIFVDKRNGREAMTFLNRQKEQHILPSLILLDINMPIMDGKETLLAIKNDPKLKNIPLVIFSTSNNKLDQFFFARYGAEMVTKPSRISDLKHIIRSLVVAYCA